MNNSLSKIYRLALFIIIYSVVFLLFYKTLPYTLPFILAIMFSMILKDFTRYIHSHFNLNFSISSLITTLLFYITIIITIFSFSSVLYIELSNLYKDLSSYIISLNLSSKLYDFRKFYLTLDPKLISTLEYIFKNFITNIFSLTTSNISPMNHTFNFINSLPYLFMVISFTLISTYFVNKDISSTTNSLGFIKKYFSSYSTTIYKVYNEFKLTVINYTFSYLLLVFITFLITWFGFSLFKIKYCFSLSFLTAIFDLLPLIGASIVYIPLIIIFFINNNYAVAIGLISLFVFQIVLRQILESKVLSNSLGISPLAVLISIFIGLQLGGLVGIVFFIFLNVFYNILSKLDII